MEDRLKVINFLQDFGCAKLNHLQKLFGDENDNFKNILYSNMISKKGEILILAFPNREELENIDCEIPFLYTTYPELVVLNNDEDEENTEENEEIT